MAKNVRVTRNLDKPEAAGNHYRLLCLTGKNKGLCYYLKGNRVVMGRSDKADIQVLDSKSSREHVELTKVGESFVLTDLGSQNGVVVNDLKVTQHNLANTDKIIIGQTVYKFDVIKVEEQNFEVDLYEEDEEDEEEFEEEEEESSSKSKKKKPNKRILILLVVAAALFLFLDDDGGKKPGPKKGSKVANEVDIDEPERIYEEEEEVKVQVNAILHRGQREYREGNYFRAIEEFSRALLLSPNHGRASFLKNKSEQKLNEEIEKLFLKAKREIDALKYDSAIKSYCSIIRYLKDYKDEDQRYSDAEKNLEVIEDKTGKAKGEIKCF